MFREWAPRFVEKGYSPIPIIPAKKRPVFVGWQQYSSRLPNENELNEWSVKWPQFNVGLCMGTVNEEDGTRILAIDVDDDDLVQRVLRAIGGNPPAKKGKKGVTYFVRTRDPDIKNTKLKRVTTDATARPSVEILANGNQTVVPPSIHPDTNQPYQWIGPSLLDVEYSRIPIIRASAIDEMLAICSDQDDKFQALNGMTRGGGGVAGNSHNACTEAVASMVSRGWTDEEIYDRIIRADREACLRQNTDQDWPDSNRIIREWTESARKKFTGGKTVKKKTGASGRPKERVMAEWGVEFLGGDHYVACVDGELRKYVDGHWPLVDTNALAKAMFEADPKITKHEVNAAIEIIHTLQARSGFGRTPDTKPRDDEKRQRVCLLNGTLNMRNGDFGDHDPDHELRHQLGFTYNDDDKCPVYDEVVAFTFNNCAQSIQLWDEFCALTLIDDMSFQKMLFLRGPGGNGKGTLARILTQMHAPSAVSSVAITELNDERKRTGLVGKLVNISGEQSRLNLVSDTYLKKITGEDPIDVRKLYQETQNNVMLSVRFLELVNEMPQTSDTSNALKRRIVLLECPNRVQNPDPDLDRKLLQERPGILARWVRALRVLYKRGAFDIPEASVREVDEYLIENSPVDYWLREKVAAIGPDVTGTSSKELYYHFAQWCKEAGLNRFPISEMQWSRKLKERGYDSYNQKIGGKVLKCRRLKITEDIQ